MPHSQDLQLQPLLQPPPLQRAHLLNPDVFLTDPCLVMSTNSIAWDPESSHALARGTINSRHGFISQTCNLSRMRRAPQEPPGQRGVPHRSQVLLCLRRAGEGRRKPQSTKVQIRHHPRKLILSSMSLEKRPH